MSIVIQGMEMPPERQSLHIIIKYNGIVCDALSGEDVAIVYELPPHGDLIDRDELADFVARTIEEARKNAIPINETYLWQLINEILVNAPVIIPADRREP